MGIATSQEKIAGALASILFFVPLIMGVKTEFTVKYMKQGFIINVAELAIGVLSSLLWGLIGILSLVHLACVLTSLFLAYQAFMGKEYIIHFLYENAGKLIQMLKIEHIFTPGK